ncbi:unnamed protein product [Danaus chrysippus]|uniref:(African queen) hypothetical protein n=1 Tax=Danaus chrysippus TaxID=151541 RepID=A0A8J2QV93_9NEOP|nr:unnamed protein product [Danaus chrysippus]
MLSDFAKEKVFWTRKMNLRLVKFIESRPNIWNPKHPKYTSVAYRDRTYAEFAAKYGNEFTGQAVKERWTNIRSTFSNYLRKTKASQAKDTEEYQVNWHLWNACQFLLRVNKSVKQENEEIHHENTEEQSTIPDDSEEDNSDADITNSSNLCKSLAESLVSAFKGIKNDAFGVNNTKNDRIGRLVTKKLNQMSSLDAAELSMRIMEVLWRYDANNPLNPNNLKTESI